MSKIPLAASLNSSNFDAKELMLSVPIITFLTFLTLIFLTFEFIRTDGEFYKNRFSLPQG